MEKSKLKLESHLTLSGENVVEVWYEGKFIATVTGADVPGVRIVTKYPLDIIRGEADNGLGETLRMIEVQIESS